MTSGCVRQYLKSKRCSIVVDGSFFPQRLWHISASWYVVSDSTIIGAGNFITSATTDYRSAHAAELCRYLADLQSIDYFLSELNESSKIDVCVATDCLVMMRKL